MSLSSLQLSASASMAAVGLLAACSMAVQAEALVLSLPVTCQLQKTCFVQSYMDLDAGKGAHDYRCGQTTYDGHKGTDFRLVSMRTAGNIGTVVAAADGTVKAARNNMPDRLLGKDTSAVRGRECGNGVVISHGEDWETQYCHLRRGSVRVSKGRKIRRGDALGRIGLSRKDAVSTPAFHAAPQGDTGRPVQRRGDGH